MRLIIDIGNSRAKVAVFDGTELVSSMRTDHDLTDLPDMVTLYPCQQGIVSTTAGLTERAEQRIAALPFEVLRMTGETPVPIQVLYHTPQTLGSDRLAAVVGAWAQYPKRNILIIDAGSCITYDFLDNEGNYRGGNISPGLGMRLNALHEHTARLPKIDSEGDTPEVGYDTETAIRSGVCIGIRHEIEGYIKAFREKYPDVLVFLTGGDAFHLDMSKENCTFADEFLVLRGLNNILAYNI